MKAVLPDRPKGISTNRAFLLRLTVLRWCLPLWLEIFGNAALKRDRISIEVFGPSISPETARNGVGRADEAILILAVDRPKLPASSSSGSSRWNARRGKSGVLR